MHRFRPRLTYSNVMATLGVFLGLGGTAWAVAANSVGTEQLKNGAVTNPKLAANSVGTGKVIDGSLLADDLRPGVVPRHAYVKADPPVYPADGFSTVDTLYEKGPLKLLAACTHHPHNSQEGPQLSILLDTTVKATFTGPQDKLAPNGAGRTGTTVQVPAGSHTQPILAATPATTEFYWYGGAPISVISDTTSIDGVISYGVNGYHVCEASFFGA
jgi:hypothetical protein